jgi:hypothetical protein
VLEQKGIKPRLPLEKDLELTDQAMSYDATTTARTSVTIRNNPLARAASEATPKPANVMTSRQTEGHATVIAWPTLPNGAPDFAKMTPAQRLGFDQSRLTRKFG